MAEHLPGMGAINASEGFAFRVWAPHARSVAVFGEFNDWSVEANPMTSEENGYWYHPPIENASAGHEYKLWLANDDNGFARRDPYSFQVTNSVGNSVLYNHDAFDWGGNGANCPPHNSMVIYELHVGTFNNGPDADGTLHDVAERLDHLVDLGVNAIQLMPVAEFAGDQSWGYNPSDPFAVESAYGGPDALKSLVKQAHERGIAVILDVVYNHFGPSDLDLWQFDGWSENDLGGIYFYNDWRASTPWGDTRPDYGREEVRRYIRDNVLMWLANYQMDGLRLDMTPFMRSVDGTERNLPEGWDLMRWLAETVRQEYPGRIIIAEDLHGDPHVTSTDAGGAAFHAQWDALFVHPVREALEQVEDHYRSIADVTDALTHSYGDPFARVIYTESHDEVANGRSRVPASVDEGDQSGWAAQKRSTLGAALMLTAPGIPMLFQGQEFLEGGWFRDDVPLDWRRREDFAGIANLYADLISLRLNRWGHSRGLTGGNIHVFHADEETNLLAYHRWAEGGPGDSVVVVVNLSAQGREDQRVGLPSGGLWTLRFNSDAPSYSALFGHAESFDLEAHDEGADGLDFHGNVTIAPYSVLIYSQGA